jgi:TolB protein
MDVPGDGRKATRFPIAPTDIRAVRRLASRLGLVALVLAVTALVASAGSGQARVRTSANGLIAYDSDVAGPLEIYVMNPDGSAKRRITRGGQNGVPSWSPDGRWIAFVSNRHRRDEIYVMNADGSHRRRLTNDRPSATFAAWAPDGSKIAYVRNNCDSKCDIYLIRPDGSGKQRLTRSGRNAFPSWSPDSSKIAFTHADAGSDRSDIYVMNADGTGAVNLTANLPGGSYEPAWSPDGTTIAFTYACGGCDEQLAFMNADGTQQRGLIFYYDNEPVPASEPAWSPDGKQIVFQTQQTLWVMNADGTAASRVAFDGDNHNPNWQPLPAPSTP